MIKLPQLDRMLAKVLVAPGKRTLRPLTYPHLAELTYAQVLRGLSKRASDAIQRELLANFKTPEAIIKELRKRYGVPENDARRAALSMLEPLQKSHARDFARTYQSSLAVNPLLGNEKWLKPAMQSAVQANVALIQSIPSRLFDDVQHLVTQSVLSGQRHETLAQDIQARFGVSERRAALVARDQTAKWYGALQAHRQQDAGIEQFEWMTVGDERVRPDHRQRDGKTYSWKTADKLPGVSDVQCRCQALPVLPEWEEDTAEVLAPVVSPKRALESVPVPAPVPVAPPVVTPPAPRAPRELDHLLADTRVQQPASVPKLDLTDATVTETKSTLIGLNDDGSTILGTITSVRAHEGDMDLVKLHNAHDTPPKYLIVSVIQASEERRGYGTKLYAAGYDIADARKQTLVSDRVENRSDKANGWWQKQVAAGHAHFNEELERFVLTKRPMK